MATEISTDIGSGYELLLELMHRQLNILTETP